MVVIAIGSAVKDSLAFKCIEKRLIGLYDTKWTNSLVYVLKPLINVTGAIVLLTCGWRCGGPIGEITWFGFLPGFWLIDSLGLKSHTFNLPEAKVNTARDSEWISQSLLHDWLGRFRSW